MEIWGKTFDGYNVYQLSDKFGVTDMGELLELNDEDRECSNIYKPYIVDLPDDFDWSSKEATDYCKGHIIDLENMEVSGYKINLVEKTINGEPFEIVNGIDDDPESVEIASYKGFWVSVYPDGEIAVNGVPDGETEKELFAIGRALNNDIDNYVPIDEVNTSF